MSNAEDLPAENSNPGRSRARRDFVGGFLKGLDVILAFDERRSKQSIAEVAKVTGLDRATCRRLLLTLVHAGYADHDGKDFWLTPRIIELGTAYLRSASLPNLIQPYLERLSVKLNKSCSCSKQDDLDIIYIARASVHRILSVNLIAGTRLPMFCTSMGRVLLAGHDDDTVSDILRRSELNAFTPKTIVEPDKLRAEVGRVREQGFAVIDQELAIGLLSIAVPIRSPRGECIAAMNIGTHASSSNARWIEERCLPDMFETQREIEKLVATAVF